MQFTHLVLAVLEGLTEYLPISSTAHLILAGRVLAVDLTDPYIKFYLLFIQLGALLAGILLFTKRILTDRALFINLIVSFVPTALIGFAFYKSFKHLLEGNFLLMASVLAVGGIILIWLERWWMPRLAARGKGDRTDMTLRDAAVVGVTQAFAIVPGVSRSGVTIVTGILLGLRKGTIVEYTFLLALPTLGAAVLYDAYKSRDALMALTSYADVLAGFAVAAVVGFVTLLILRRYLARLPLAAFGAYRIMLAVAIFWFLI